MSRPLATPDMTDRQVFDLVAAHLRSQGRPSMGPRACMYRSADGAACAAGCLIADEHYRPRLEGLSSSSPEVAAALVASGVPDRASCLSLVAHLQMVHDSSLPGDGWMALVEHRLAELERGLDLRRAGVIP